MFVPTALSPRGTPGDLGVELRRSTPRSLAALGMTSCYDVVLSRRRESKMPRQLPSPVLYENHYTWFVLVSALDVMLTWVVLHAGGREANAIADAVLRNYGLGGMVAFKFALVALVIVICEVVGRRSIDAGRRLAGWAVALTCVPLLIAVALLWGH